MQAAFLDAQQLHHTDTRDPADLVLQPSQVLQRAALQAHPVVQLQNDTPASLEAGWGHPAHLLPPGALAEPPLAVAAEVRNVEARVYNVAQFEDTDDILQEVVVEEGPVVVCDICNIIDGVGACKLLLEGVVVVDELLDQRPGADVALLELRHGGVDQRGKFQLDGQRVPLQSPQQLLALTLVQP